MPMKTKYCTFFSKKSATYHLLADKNKVAQPLQKAVAGTADQKRKRSESNRSEGRNRARATDKQGFFISDLKKQLKLL